MMGAEFADAFAYGLDVSWIAKGETANAVGDLCPRTVVAELAQLCGEGLGFADFERKMIVACRLQLSYELGFLFWRSKV
jgi:hypothetical protein